VALALPCDALLFDSDGVLVDSDRSVVLAWSRWAVRHGLEPDGVHPVVHGRRAHDTVAALLPADVHGQALEEINRFELEGAEHVTAIAGAPELTRALAGQAWSVVTSATRTLAGARLAAAGIAAPRVLVSADDVARGKPAPDGYRLAAERLGHESLELIRRQHGVDPALRRGLGWREDVPVPVLPARVGFTHEKHLATGGAARHHHQDGVFLVDPGQVQQIAVLPVFVLDVIRVDPDWRTPEDRQRVRSQPFHGARVARLQIILERPGRHRGRGGEHQYEHERSLSE